MTQIMLENRLCLGMIRKSGSGRDRGGNRKGMLQTWSGIMPHQYLELRKAAPPDRKTQKLPSKEAPAHNG
jgi:hypothetical protein